MPDLDQTHDPARRSWVESANDPASDFPIQNLPLGVFRPRGGDEPPRIGAAIGDQILDLHKSVEHKLLRGISPPAACALSARTLNDFLALGRRDWRDVRANIADVLDAGNRARSQAQAALSPMSHAQMLVPVAIGDYTDFYASIDHATNVGSMFRPDNPLLPNYKHLPVGYHGRASSIVVSGTPVRRPMGQIVSADAGPPAFAPCRLLDYEMEMGFFVGPGNAMGDRIPISQAGEHIFGMVIVNDWSARDIQKWEYQPLGPFNAKNFATSISPWVVTMEALAPFRVPGPPRDNADPQPLEYLRSAEHWGLDLTVEVWLSAGSRRDPLLISRGNAQRLYWTIAQMLAHHTSTGCNLRPGDLLATGTISGPAEDSRGCLLERTWRGTKPIAMPDGTSRTFLLDGDEVIMRCYAAAPGRARVGFGDCRGAILPAA